MKTIKNAEYASAGTEADMSRPRNVAGSFVDTLRKSARRGAIRGVRIRG
jgi:hypothetical protein